MIGAIADTLRDRFYETDPRTIRQLFRDQYDARNGFSGTSTGKILSKLTRSPSQGKAEVRKHTGITPHLEQMGVDRPKKPRTINFGPKPED